MEIKGGCLCGNIQYTISGAKSIQEISLCHCSMCRKASGSAFLAVAPIPVSTIQWKVENRGEMSVYESSPGKERVFCSKCGSPLFSRRIDLPDVLRLRVGTLNDSISHLHPNIYHIHTDSKADWFDLSSLKDSKKYLKAKI